MRRREFVAALGGAATAWPIPVRAQSRLPIVGILSGTSPETAYYLAGLHEGMRDGGYVEGQNFAIETRWAEGRYDRLPALAIELAGLPVAVMIAGGIPPLMAAKAATSTIPIVFSSAADPVQLGLVASLNRPGGNVTGVSHFGVALAPKRLQLLLELVPAATVIGVLENPNNARTELEAAELDVVARSFGKQILIVKADKESDFESAFTTLVQARAGGLLVAGEPFFIIRRQQLATLAARHAIPAIYDYRNFAAAGGLLSYGIDLTEMYRLVGAHVARILKGAKPGDLPIIQPTRFELVVNLKAARAIGLAIPESFLARADEVIE